MAKTDLGYLDLGPREGDDLQPYPHLLNLTDPLFRMLTSFSDRPKPGKRAMPIPPLIRTSIPRAVEAAAMLHAEGITANLFHDQIILYGFDPFDASCDFTPLYRRPFEN